MVFVNARKSADVLYKDVARQVTRRLHVTPAHTKDLRRRALQRRRAPGPALHAHSGKTYTGPALHARAARALRARPGPYMSCLCLLQTQPPMTWRSCCVRRIAVTCMAPYSVAVQCSRDV
jgi:hypothetical protein